MFTILLSLAMLNLPYTLTDFSKPTELAEWKVVNDGVMGGMSEARLSNSSEGHALYQGEVSLENNGGFSSIRKSFESTTIKGAKTVHIKLKGDKKNYQFRVKTNRNDRHAFKYEFETTGQWQTIKIKLKEMTPTYRGMRPNIPNYQAEILSEIGFLIANKKAEKFNLLIDSIWLN
jgi:NADH dehydrogenase [ubiquinone] 1 alpha subcomplex assembly factor 1